MLIDNIHINFNVCINYAFDGKLSHNAAQREQSAPKARAPPSNCAVVNYQVGGSSSSSAAPVIVFDALRAAAPPTQTRPPPPPAHSSSHQRPNGSPIPPWRQPLQLQLPPPPPPRRFTDQELLRMTSHRIQMQQLMTWGQFIANCMAFHQSHLPVPAAPSIGEVVPVNTTGLTNVSFPPTPFVDLQHMIPPTLPAATTPASTLPAPHTLPAATTPASTPPAPHPAQTAPTPEQALPEPEPEVCYEDEETLRSLLLGYASSMPAAPVIPRPPKGSPPASTIHPPTQPTREPEGTASTISPPTQPTCEPEGTHAVRPQSTTPLSSDDECRHHIDGACVGSVRSSSSSSSYDGECRNRPTTRPRPAKAVNCARMHAPRLYHACACHPQIKMRM